ncbi:MAG: hypothetical protein Q8927_17650 [Bacteroidota bacterium]|nr:hypothetical protein [Bacteroidota bacterium]MDP4218032.1 hypothetical protein [Bacteroidota bacterium]MDP4246218.1 hypothetical protein [Bacteroidota bacterium]MDP4253007.1 hypothetical protein [Bacteroidota bacterium]MDP4258714.1 hypothetical protein [Bacteroidota bacterium]
MMPLPEIFALGILAYLVYRLIFNFFVPIFKTTRQVRQQFRHMRDSMNGNPPNHRPNGTHSASGPSSGKASSGSPGAGNQRNAGKSDQHPSFDSIGEYIDFEEIKK